MALVFHVSKVVSVEVGEVSKKRYVRATKGFFKEQAVVGD